MRKTHDCENLLRSLSSFNPRFDVMGHLQSDSGHGVNPLTENYTATTTKVLLDPVLVLKTGRTSPSFRAAHTIKTQLVRIGPVGFLPMSMVEQRRAVRASRSSSCFSTSILHHELDPEPEQQPVDTWERPSLGFTPFYYSSLWLSIISTVFKYNPEPPPGSVWPCVLSSPWQHTGSTD